MFNSVATVFCLLIIFEQTHQAKHSFVKANKEAKNPYKTGQLPTVNNADWTESEELEQLLKPIDHFLNNYVTPLMGLPARDVNGTASQFRREAMEDDVNDDATFMNAQEIIKRSGFDYEIYHALSDDGYYTQMTRLVNPRADRTKLRHPPVMMMHGGLIDTTAYLIASSIQHFPEVWPPPSNSGAYGYHESRHGHRSSNRSLAFLLANNGFDVFLVETRGANEYNRGHIKTKALESAIQGKDEEKNMTKGEVIDGIKNQFDYWSFTEDDIIQHEIKAQMDKIMEITGSEQLSLFVFSLSTRTSLGFLATRPDYARRLRAFAVMAPIISGEGMAGAARIIIQKMCAAAPVFLGRFVLTDILLTPQIRSLIVDVSKPKWLRYLLTKFLVSVLVGSSAKYRTNLELNVIGHLFLHLSYKMVKQMCQSTSTDTFRKYDHGLAKNRLIYKSDTPPFYDLSNIQVEDYITITGTNDNFATDLSYDHLMKLINPKPIAHYVAPGFNHLDLFAGFENDRYVNFPVLNYFIRKSDSFLTEYPDNDQLDVYKGPMMASASSSRTFKLPFLDFKPGNIIEASTSTNPPTTSNPSQANPLNSIFKFGASNPFKFPGFDKLPFIGGASSTGESNSAGGTNSGGGIMDLITKQINPLKTISHTATNVANVADVASIVTGQGNPSRPTPSLLGNVPEFAKQPMQMMEDAKSAIQNMFTDFTKLITDPSKLFQKPKSTPQKQ